MVSATVPGAGDDFVAQNVWVGLVNDEWISLYAGALRSDPKQGALLLVTVRPDQVTEERFMVPLSNGALTVESANVQRLRLVSTSGATFWFDVLAKRFVGSLTEYAATATPPPTALPTTTPSPTATTTTTPSVPLTPRANSLTALVHFVHTDSAGCSSRR